MLFSFFKRHRPDSEVPSWANFFTSKEYDRFNKLLNGYLNKRNIPFNHSNAAIHTKEEYFGAETLGLINLAQLCKQARQTHWKGLIAQHFEELKKAATFQNEFKKNVHDFSYASRYLGVRLYHNDYVSHLEDGLTIGRQFTEDIFALLVFDLPHSVMNVRPEQTIQWNKYNEELFEIGLSNIKSKYQFNISPRKIEDTTIQVVQGDHFFTPNIVLDLKSHPDLVGSKGCLIGIPSRHHVLIYPIENLKVINAISQLIPIITRLEDEGPGSISRSLFWFSDGEFSTLPYELEEEKIQFYPPEKFATLLNELKAV